MLSSAGCSTPVRHTHTAMFGSIQHVTYAAWQAGKLRLCPMWPAAPRLLRDLLVSLRRTRFGRRVPVRHAHGCQWSCAPMSPQASFCRRSPASRGSSGTIAPEASGCWQPKACRPRLSCTKEVRCTSAAPSWRLVAQLGCARACRESPCRSSHFRSSEPIVCRHRLTLMRA